MRPSEPPCGVVLYLPGDTREGHTFHITVEEWSGGWSLIRGESVRAPWLRASCTCGWQATDDQRTTIEENSHWRWLEHAKD